MAEPTLPQHKTPFFAGTKVPSPVPYSIRWTYNLICRDLKNLNKRARSKVMRDIKKLEELCKLSKTPSDSSPEEVNTLIRGPKYDDSAVVETREQSPGEINIQSVIEDNSSFDTIEPGEPAPVLEHDSTVNLRVCNAIKSAWAHDNVSSIKSHKDSPSQMSSTRCSFEHDINFGTQIDDNADQVSISTADTKYQRDITSTTRPDTGNTVITKATTASASSYKPQLDYVFAKYNTIYDWLEAQLKKWYQTRSLDLSYKQRFELRGIHMVLSRAIQAYPTNPLWDINRDKSKPRFYETRFLIDLLDLASENEAGTCVLSALGSSSLKAPVHNRISQLPTNPYLKKGEQQQIRYDSVLSTISGTFAPPSSPLVTTTPTTHPQAPPPALHLWYAIAVALADRTKSADIVKGLLGFVWPNVDAGAFLLRVGNPGTRMSDAEGQELLEKFCGVLGLE